MNYPGSLHNHTDYSNLRLRDSINKIEDLINYSIELGHEVIAITEHESISNSVKVQKYYEKIKKNNPNFKIILGNEIYLCRNELTSESYVKKVDSFWHFILLAKDKIGHQQIRMISTKAWQRSWMDGKMRRVPTYYSDLEEIIKENPGHVIGSTACLGGFLPKLILKYYETKDDMVLHEIDTWVKNMLSIFGKDFYFEMQPSNNQEQILVNKFIKKLSKVYGIEYIITTDSHYLKREDAAIHKAYLNSQDGDREVDEFYATTYLMGSEELESYFSYFTDEEIYQAYEAIKGIKEKCVDYTIKKSLKIPNLPWKNFDHIDTNLINKYTFYIPKMLDFLKSEYESDKVLVKAIIDGIESKSDLQNIEAYNEINSNLEMTWTSSRVNNAEWSAYFLNLQKIIEECWNANTLVGPGRGSGVGFILLYVLGITQINPLRETTRCFSWRFLNPDRVSVLDVDIDIEGGSRTKTLQYLKEYYGADRVSNVATFGTEKSKSAIQTAARGLGIDVDEAQYISSLIPADRGTVRTLSQAYYGDPENGYEPVAMFVKEMNNNPELWRVAQKIEGLICRIGEHAGGVIFVDEPFTNSTGLMRAPNGDIITQFDLHDCEDVSLIKYDLLSVEALDKIHTCLDLLAEDGLINNKLDLKNKYEEAIGIYNLERENPDMWQMIWRHEIESLFQMEKQSGIKGIATLKPTSVDDLAILNSTIRLMAQPGESEMPTDKLARFKKDSVEWDKELSKWGLGEKEKEILEPIIGMSYGLCIAQEQFMELVQLPELGGFPLTWADKLRKSIAKKNPKEFEELTKDFYKTTEEKGIDRNFTHYVWEVLISMSKGYGFNQSHTLAYSLIALQEMNLCFKFPIIYWNCACAITNSGGMGSGTDYNKIATTINKMRNSGIKVSLPDINNSIFEFRPDSKNNTVLCGLKNLSNVGDDLVEKIIQNRPYVSIKDFYYKVSPNKQAMISLIKGGAFDTFMERKDAMIWYLWETCEKKKRLTLQNLSALMQRDLVPNNTKDLVLAKRVYEFNRYLKAICKSKTDNTFYHIDDRSLDFLNSISWTQYEIKNDEYLLNIKTWDKTYQTYMDVFRDWMAQDRDKILQNLNHIIFMEDWNKYALGNYSSWEMESLCFYYHDHELLNVNKDRYGFSSFSSLPKEPEVDRQFTKGNKTITLYKLHRICGTCIAKDKIKSTVSLLTTDGVVTVKFRKEYFSLFDKQISQRGEDGKKHVIQKSWFNRGNMIVVMGVRNGDEFVAKKYASSNGHQLYLITQVNADNTLVLTGERPKGELMEE